MPGDAEQIIKRVEKLRGIRANYETLWQDQATYCMPMKDSITQVRTPGTAAGLKNYDDTAMNANQIISAGLHSYLTNPASRWFSLRPKRKALMESKTVRLWMSSAEEVVYNALNGSNFAQEIHECYLDLCSLGTAVLYEEEDPEDHIRFFCRPLKECFLAEGEDGRVDTVYREFKLTARQAKQRWGDKAGEAVERCLAQQDTEKELEFIHAVYPRYERDAAKGDSANMEFASIYVEKSMKHLISEGGYKQFPYFIPRFSKLSGEVYGYSPATVAMPAIKMLNAVSKTYIRYAQKKTDPPIELPHDGYLLPLNLNPGGFNYRLAGTADDGLKPIETGGDPNIGLEVMQRYEKAIQRAFFVDVFLMVVGQEKDMTATEVQERVAEKMLILGPVLGRLMNELLDPLIQRTINILAEQGALPPVPPELENEDYQIEYVSPLAKAQKYQEINSINNMLALVEQLAQGFPNVLDKIDSDQVIDVAAAIHGVDPSIILDDDEVTEIRKQKAEQMQVEKEMMMAQQIAGAAKQGAGAVKDLAQAGAQK